MTLDTLTGVSHTVSAGDTMLHNVDNFPKYLKIGESAMKNIRWALAAGRKTDVRSILDFGCGHGRIMRHLRAEFPSAKITACDIDREGVDFCAATFAAIPVYSTRKPWTLPLHGPYDLIWMGSVITHLAKPIAWKTLDFAMDKLSPGGVLVFSSQGRYSFAFHGGHVKYMSEERFKKIRRGYAWFGYGYNDYEDPKVPFGVSVIRPSTLLRFFERREDITVLGYLERGHDNYQDIVAILKCPITQL